MNSNEPTPIDDDLLALLLAEEAALTEGRESEYENRDGLRDCLQLLRTLGRQGGPPTGPLQFGRFTIEGELGRGGFGIVYRAHDPLLGRLVALKVPRPELMASSEIQRRFLREARATGGLDHPNIVPVLDAGPLGPVCFIASAYCPGPTLSQWLKARAEPVPARTAAHLMAELASATQHAHERGVLHRDIKPSNVILSEGRGPLAASTNPIEFMPKLTDFGLAKLVDEGGDETRPMALIGSPPYMAPEQASGRHADVGPATDIHALGAVLYEILVGRPPYLGESRTETLRLVIEAEPISPRALRPRLSRDLERITLACLEKSPARRYASAEALRDDLVRFLAGLPIRARPVSIWRTATARLRRHPTLSSSLAMLILALAGIVGLLAWSNGTRRDLIIRLVAEKSRADAHSAEAELQRLLAERRLRGARMMLASQALDDQKIELAQDILNDMDSAESGGRVSSFAEGLLRDRAHLETTPLRGHRRDVEGLALAEDGRTLLSGDLEGVIKIWDLQTEPSVATLTGHTLPVKFFRSTSNGRYLVSVASSFGRLQSEVKIWDLHSRRLIASVEGVDDCGVDGVAFDRIGVAVWIHRYGGSTRRSDVSRFVFLASIAHPVSRPPRVSPNQLHLLTDGRVVEVVAQEAVTTDRWLEEDKNWITWITPGHPAVLNAFASTADGSALAVACRGGDVVCRESKTGAVVGRFNPEGGIHRMEFSPDGRVLAAGSDDGTVSLWDRVTNRRLRLPISNPAREKPVHVFAFSDDGSKFAVSEWAVSGGATPAMIFEVATGRKIAEYPGRRDRCANLRFAPDGRSLFIASGPTIRRWFFERREPPSPKGHASEAWAVAFNPVDGLLVSGSDDDGEAKTIRQWNPVSETEGLAWHAGRGTVASLAFSEDGRWLASGHLAPTANVRVWDARTGIPVAAPANHGGKVRAVAFQPSGGLLASAGSDGKVRLWDVAAGRGVCELVGHTLTVQGLAFEPGGRRLASSGSDGSVRLWDVDTGLCLALLHGAEQFTAIAFSSDGATLAAADEDGEVTLWDAATFTRRSVLRGESGIIRSLAFSPEDTELVVGGETGSIEFWEYETGQRVLKLKAGDGAVHSLAFSPDGRSLAAAVHSGAVKIFRSADRSRRLLKPQRLRLQAIGTGGSNQGG